MIYSKKTIEKTRLQTKKMEHSVLANYFLLFLILSSFILFKDTENKEAIWLYAELFLGHHDGSCHGLW